MPHCLLTCGQQSGQPLAPEQLTAINTALQGHSYIRTWPGTYVVAVLDATEVSQIHNALSKQLEVVGEFSFLLTPALPDGIFYAGRLPGNLWPEVNRRSGAPESATRAPVTA